VISTGILPSPGGAASFASSVKAQQAVRYSFFFLAFLDQCSVELGDSSLGGQGSFTVFMLLFYIR
jgi:hypothetical protein